MSVKSTLAIAVLSILAAGSAIAAEGTQDFNNLPLSSKSRAEVVADIRNASALQANDGWPSVDTRSTLTRAQVVAETREAQRLDLISNGDELKLATPAQSESIRLAGERAITSSMAANR
jgi:hypothetical protein